MSKKNKGYITVEASIVVPLFLFFMLGMSGLYMVLMAEAHIHQALASAVDYAAQYSYFEKQLLSEKNDNQENNIFNIEQLVDAVIIKNKFNSYIGEDFYVEKVVVGGKNGIVIRVEEDPMNKKVMIVTAKYFVTMHLPLLRTYSIPLSNQIKQKTFVGFSKEEFLNGDYYVYVTPNREAYHMRRDCTHLMLDIRSVSEKNKALYKPCYYCGKITIKNRLYVTKENDIFHTTKGCVGLKRTVTRVKLSTVEGLGVCSRCGG